MFKKLLKRKTNETPKQTSGPEIKEQEYADLDDEDPVSRSTPQLPDRPVPPPPRKDPATGRIIVKKDALVNLPVQNVLSLRRKEDIDFDDDDYGYSDYTESKFPKRRCKEEEVAQFLDAHTFYPCHKDAERPMVSRYFFISQGRFDNLSCEEIIQEIAATDNTADHQADILKYITSIRIPESKKNGNILDIFTLMQSQNRSIRNLCIFELFDLLLNLNIGKISTDYARNLMDRGVVITFSVISETKKNAPIFQTLIQMGITLTCFLYLKALNEVYQWKESLEKTHGEITEKYQKVLKRKDPDVQIFVEITQCLFNLDEIDIDESCLIGVDLNNFIHHFTREESSIFIEGFVKLYHTCNLIFHAPSKFKQGIQDLVQISAFMNGCNDREKINCFQRLFATFAVQILNREKSEVKIEILAETEDKLLSVLLSEELLLSTSKISECLLFHPVKRIRDKYMSLVRAEKLKSVKSAFKEEIENILKKCAFRFESQELLSEREQCTFCGTDGSLTCIYVFKDDVSTEMYDNTNLADKELRRQKLEKELEILKGLESKDIHKNVTRLLAFYQFLPKFYIKERLPGDNLQRRLLEIRDKGNKAPILHLINVIIQAVEAVIYVHGCGILVRDITTASFGCTKTDNGFFIKLKNFEMAADSSEFGSGGIVDGLTDLDFNGVPTRWAAPESLLEGHYSIYSDVWSVSILTDEILNYAAWPYSEVTDADVDSLITNVVFTHLKPQGFNRPRRIQGLLLEGLSSEPEQRLKLEALKERLVDVCKSFTENTSNNEYETYAGTVGGNTKVVYDVPPLTKHQIDAKSIFERGIPKCMKKYRSQGEDPYSVFAQEIADNKENLGQQKGVTAMEISSVDNYKIESEDIAEKLMVKEHVSEEFLQYTYQRLRELDTKKMSIEPWPPRIIENEDGTKSLKYKLPRSTSLLDMVLHKERGESLIAYIELLYDLAVHVDSFHSAGWIFRCLRAKNIWIKETRNQSQNIVVAKVGSYRVIASGDKDIHFEQLKVEEKVDKDSVQWLPIEALKAQLYSKESDVYAFGMVTWEVMTAYGQEGVVYHSDEERELDCIPFNYQDSNDILQHLIDGYIPEKPLKCPDWLYGEITRPCLFHQKIGRPSMKTITQILALKLNKPPPLPPPLLDSNVYEPFIDECYDEPESMNKEGLKIQKHSSKPLPTPPLIQGNDQSSPDDTYDDCSFEEEQPPLPPPVKNIPNTTFANMYETLRDIDKDKTSQRKKPSIPLPKTPANIPTAEVHNEIKKKIPPSTLPKPKREIPSTGKPVKHVIHETSTVIQEQTTIGKQGKTMADITIIPSSETNHNLAQAQCVKPNIQPIYENHEFKKEPDKPPPLPPRKPIKN